MWENNHVKAFWDVQVYADQTDVRTYRVDERIVDRERSKDNALEMSCSWVENGQQKEEEKTLKYAPLRMELKRQHPRFEIKQANVIIDALSGYSKGLTREYSLILAYRHLPPQRIWLLLRFGSKKGTEITYFGLN